jgi:hypothetical protein
VYSGMRFQGAIERIPELYCVGGFGTAIAAIALLPPLLKGKKS